MISRINILLVIAAASFFSACNPLNKFQSAAPDEIKSVLSSYLPLNAVAPDDPAFFDDSINTNTNYCPKLSEPYW